MHVQGTGTEAGSTTGTGTDDAKDVRPKDVRPKDARPKDARPRDAWPRDAWPKDVVAWWPMKDVRTTCTDAASTTCTDAADAASTTMNARTIST